jgi:hypothetical protein
MRENENISGRLLFQPRIKVAAMMPTRAERKPVNAESRIGELIGTAL